ncbi:diphthamine biosynthesis 3 [Cricetulus griseus]
MAVFHDEVEIEDFQYDEDSETYFYPCPCGDNFSITKEDLENGEDVATCPSCSLIIKVIYDKAESLEMLQREHEQVMSDLQKLPIEISEALNKCKWLIEENESYMEQQPGLWASLPAQTPTSGPVGALPPVCKAGLRQGRAEQTATKDSQHKELLPRWQQSLAQALSKVEPMLGGSGSAKPRKVAEAGQGDRRQQGEALLQVHLAEEQDHFQDLGSSLKKMQPHLLPIRSLKGVIRLPQFTDVKVE